MDETIGIPDWLQWTRVIAQTVTPIFIGLSSFVALYLAWRADRPRIRVRLVADESLRVQVFGHAIRISALYVKAAPIGSPWHRYLLFRPTTDFPLRSVRNGQMTSNVVEPGTDRVFSFSDFGDGEINTLVLLQKFGPLWCRKYPRIHRRLVEIGIRLNSGEKARARR